jgi:hypothetical protein
MSTSRIDELAKAAYIAAQTEQSKPHKQSKPHEQDQYDAPDTRPHKLILFRMHHRYKLMYQLQALFKNKEDIIDYMARMEEFTLFNEYPEYVKYIQGAQLVKRSILNSNSNILKNQELENESLATYGMTNEEYDAALVLAAIRNVLEHN